MKSGLTDRAVLHDPLPDGWTRPDIAWRDPATVEVVREVVAGPEVDLAAELAPVIARDIKPDNIVARTPGVMGGAPCIAGTRVPVSALVELRRDGWNAGQIQRDGYPHLPLSTIDAALAWADAHPDDGSPAPLSATVSATSPGLSATREPDVEPLDDDAGDDVCAHGNPWDDCRACSLGLDDVAAAASARTVRLAPSALDIENIAATWFDQWRSLVEVDPSTLTAGGRRRREAMLAIAAHVRGAQTARAERIETAARTVLGALDLCPCGQIVATDDAAILALRAALCTCAGHGPDLACVEHGEGLRKWQRENTP